MNLSSFKNIVYEVVDSVAKITINRPPLNILTIEALSELAMTLKPAKADDRVRTIVITGAGDRAFSTSADVKEHFPDRSEKHLMSFIK